VIPGATVNFDSSAPLFWFELAGVRWSGFGAGTLQAQPPSLSVFLPWRNTYLSTDESIRGQGEARKIPSLNVPLVALGFQIRPPQQVSEARVVIVLSFNSVQVAAVSKDTFGLAVLTHLEHPRFPGFFIVRQANKRVTAVVFELDHRLTQVL